MRDRIATRTGWAPLLCTAWSVEFLKLRRSMMARLITPLLTVVVPLGSVGAVALARSPELPGAAAVKFAPYAVGDLATTQLLVAGQILSVALLTAGGFAAAWSYGREFSDGTAGALAGLAVPRRSVGLAKALLLVTWLIGCVVVSILVTLLLSLMVGGRPGAGAWQEAAVAILAGLLAVGLVPPFTCVATLTRSQLGTVGVLLGVVMVTQIVVVLGAGVWFPFAVPSLLTGMGGDEVAGQIGVGSILLTAAVGPASVLVVAWQWGRLSDT
ncbi:MAG: ABC transporter permease [Micropruina sp.]|uniref:ABC transporter permease n=1 Tax=Micropruina sp. TaxID=2737536 RepID=UPI0039E3F967